MVGKPDKIEIKFTSGWLRGRAVTLDESNGEAVAGPGLHCRVRADRVESYRCVEPGVVAFKLMGRKSELEMIGSIQAIDKIMERLALREVPREEQ